MRPIWLIAFALLWLPTLAAADEVYFKDGSCVVGQIVQMGYGKLKIKTDFAGELTVDAAKVKGIRTQKPMTVELKNGEHAVASLEYTPVGGQSLGGALIPPGQSGSSLGGLALRRRKSYRGCRQEE